MRVQILSLLLGLLLSQHISAQEQMFQHLSFPVIQNGKLLEYPFAGGMNAPQFSAADLNNDQIPDLVAFDRAGDVFLTFLNEGTPNTASYRYAPEYACYFPPLQDYALLRDFNQDGAADIFCASLPVGSQEMQVFQGYYENNILKFKPFLFNYPGCSSCDNRFVYYPSVIPGFWNNLFIADTDVPGVVDVDGDGDLDILTFDGAAGGHVWLVKNTSVEKGFGTDSLHFEVVDRCWGRFYETGLNFCVNNISPRPDTCVDFFTSQQPVVDRGEQTRHPGSTLMLYDQDGDGDLELVTGDVSFTCMNMMTNYGTPSDAWMAEQDVNFPSYNTPVDLPQFPAAYYLDLNNDGKGDLVVAPNSKFVQEDRNGVWFYQNTATTGHSFELDTKRFLVGDMIDVGTAAHPALVDANADGLLDLVVGNYGYFTPGNAQNASLYLYLNTGTPTEPRFTLTDSDWLGLSAFAPNDFDFYPAFGDLDNDGDLDLLIGSNLGALYYFRNTADAGNPMQFQQDFNVMWAFMDVGSYSTPALVDLDNDGAMDIVVGERNGNVNFFKNMGAPDNPVFLPQPTLSKLGSIDTRVFPSDVGFSAPAFIAQPNGERLLIVGTQEGNIESYTNPTASEMPFSLVSKKWGNVDDGNRSTNAFGDLDGDGILEMVTGNLRGGLTLYKTILVDCTTSTNATASAALHDIRLSPNPARHWTRIEWPSDQAVQWQVFDLLGRTVARGEAPGGAFSIQVGAWSPGLYFLELYSDGRLAGRATLSKL
ncbi:MAG: T9SS type A sorting domain-containing protein [Lewinellaceae bacterium]|nr:T9SS type A sorting domain-containing protein [Lewinellaceae bacterium]